MRIGIHFDGDHAPLASLRRVFAGTYRVLSSRFETVLLPADYRLADAAGQERMAEEFVRGCDAIVGVLGHGVLAARRRLGLGVPFVHFTYGDLPWGAWVIREHLASLTAGDVMVVNCAAEVEIAKRLFRGARVRSVPLPFDPSVFHPLGDDERRAARAKLGFGDADRVVLYAGRLTPEKSAHRLLDVFDVVARRNPRAHLVLAGGVGQAQLPFFGVASVSFNSTFSRLISRLEHADRVHVPGPADDRRLRELYCAADLGLNLTLNPDENFGLAQVEAMACGTPVVGTAWGGLKDTIVDGVSGWRVSTTPTATGIKLSWWEAANRVATLLEDDAALGALRGRCRATTERFTLQAFGAAMEEVLLEAGRGRDRPAKPLRPTPFAEEFWSVCDPRWPGAAYRRGPRSEELHRTLVTPFTGVSPAHAPAWEEMQPDQVLSLATPVHPGGGAAVRLDDVFHALPVEVPEAHRDAVHAVLARMRERPALRVAELEEAVGEPGLADALAWMLEAGLVLRTLAVPGWMDPASVGRRLAEPAFAVQEIDRERIDLIVYSS